MGRKMTKRDFFGVLFVQMKGVPKNQKKCGVAVISTQSDVSGVEAGENVDGPFSTFLHPSLVNTLYLPLHIIIPSPVSSIYHLLYIPHLIHTQ